MRVLFACGGTGGHINPALAMADTIKNKDPEAVIEFVGTPTGKENDLVVREGYVLHKVKMTGLKRSLSLSNVKTAYYTLTAPIAAKKIIKNFAPDVVVGTGGYACYPTLMAASKLGIPTLVHESNASPGKAVKLLRNRVDKILVNFDKTADMLGVDKKKVVHVGNPVRGAFCELDRDGARKTLGVDTKYEYMVVSCGGSGGAERINTAVLEMMKEHLKDRPDVLIVHAAGDRDYDNAKKLFDEAGLGEYDNLQLVKYIYDMPIKMAAADVIVCRAGAMTLSEMAMMGRASIIIPSPNVADNHQFVNANTFFENGAASMIEEKDLSPDALFSELEKLLGSSSMRASYEKKVQRFAIKDANERICREICAFVK